MTQQSETLVLSLISTTVLEVERISDRNSSPIGGVVKRYAKTLCAMCEEYFLTLDDNDESDVDCMAKFDLLAAIQSHVVVLADSLARAGAIDDAEALRCASTFIGRIDLDEAGFLTLKQ